jgi:hypothetical protein
MCIFAPFVVTSTMCGASRPFCGGIYTVGGYGDGFFLNMDGGVIFGLDLLRHSLYFVRSYVLVEG